MQFSSKVLRCEQSPMRKFHPYAVAAAAAGKKIYHLNIGQPDVATPAALFESVRSFHEKTLSLVRERYAPSHMSRPFFCGRYPSRAPSARISVKRS